MVIENYVFDIIEVSEKVTQIILRKKYENQYNLICFIAIGNVKEIVSQLKLEKKDKIRIEYYLKSKKFNDKYLTSAIISKIEIKEKRTNQIQAIFDTEEIF
jgi:hypothetical protein